jgi:hypothetical protein
MSDYLIITMKVVPYDNVSPDSIEKEIGNQTTNLPCNNLLSWGGLGPLGKIYDVKVSRSPKESL